MWTSRRTQFSLWATTGYAVFASLWIFLSDLVLAALSNPQAVARYATIKGLVFVLVTAGMLWVALQHVPPDADIDIGDHTDASLPPGRALWGLTMPLAAAALQWAIWPLLSPFAWLLFYPAVFTAAWLGGWLAGLAASLLSLPLCWVLFLEPAMQTGEIRTIPVLPMGVFFAMGLLTSLVMDLLRKHRARSANSKFEALVEQTLAGIYIIQGEHFRYVNPAFARILGYDDPAEIINRIPVSALVAAKDRERVRHHVDQRMRNAGLEVRYGFTGLKRDGSTVELEVHGRALQTQDGPAVIGMALDVTERHRAEATLRDQQALLNRMSELAKVGGWSIDVATRQGTRTAGAARILDLDPQDPRSLLVHDSVRFFRSPHLDEIQRVLARAIETGEPYAAELELVSDKGVHKWVRTQGEPIRDASGQVVRIEGAIQDITEMRLAREALRAHQERLEQMVRDRTAELESARQEAEHLARVKSEFLANMSHEIRTPLNGVLGLAQIGCRDHEGSARQIFEQINASGRLLLGILNDILDFSKIEAGKLRIDLEPLNLRELLTHTLGMVRERAQEKGLRLGIEIDPQLPTTCRSDALRLEQIALNLLSNAVKFTATGEVCLTARAAGDRWHLIVRDSGIGMTSAQLEGLFRPFEQADNSTTRRYGGTGLGLAITHRLVGLLGGEIEVHSEAGRGSTFVVNLPLLTDAPRVASTAPGSPPEPAAPPTRVAQLQGVRILAAEDNPINQLVLSELLANEGAEVTLCANGVELLNCLQAQGAAAFDVILMDIQMPVMDGYEATRAVRAQYPQLPVIGQTAHAMAEEQAKCKAAGMVDLVLKPLELDTLVRVVRRHLA